MSKFYGNLSNRFEEGKNYTGREIKPGDDVTMYLWSDRHCYYVTEVENQKRIKVRRYYTCADHSKPGGMGHQDWKYFKSWDAMNKYLSAFFPDHHNAEDHRDEPSPETWVYRYNKWMRETTHTEMKYPDAYTKRERDQFCKNGWFKSYHDLSGKVSCGVRDYHYDWEF
jgi:hypothetical protein